MRFIAIILASLLALPAFAKPSAQAPGEILGGLRPAAQSPQAVHAIEGIVGRAIGQAPALDRKSVGEGKRGEIGGRPILKKKKTTRLYRFTVHARASMNAAWCRHAQWRR